MLHFSWPGGIGLTELEDIFAMLLGISDGRDFVNSSTSASEKQYFNTKI